MEALEVAALYKDRWQVALFIWIKQNLQIKTIWGYSENAVNIHNWVAVCTYLVVAYLKYQLRSPYSVYELMQILGISVFAKTPINELLTKTQIKKMSKNNLTYLISTKY